MLKVKSFGFALGIMWAVVMLWATILHLTGHGMMVFDMLDQFYLDLFMTGWVGLIWNTILAFIDGFVAGIIFAWLYNKFAGKAGGGTCCT